MARCLTDEIPARLGHPIDQDHTLPDGTPETEIILGSVRQVMEEKMRLLTPDLLAIGAHTRSGLVMRRLGAFAAELVRQPSVDLLISPMPRV